MTIDQAINPLATITLIELMVAIGLGVTFAEVAGVATDWRLLTRAALANYVCVPAAALGLLFLFRPYTPEPESFPYVAAGFLVTAVCPGAPYGPPFTGLAKGNVVMSVGLMIILAGSSALVAPLLLHRLLPVMSGDTPVQVDPVKMIGTLLFAQLLPLTLGLLLRQWRPALATRLKNPADRASLILNLLLLAVILTAQFRMLLAIPLRAFAGMLALVLLSVAAGWLLGGAGNSNRKAMAMATSVRNVGVSLVIATASFPGTKAVTATMAFAVFQTIVMALVALSWGRLLPGTEMGSKVQESCNEDVLKRAKS